MYKTVAIRNKNILAILTLFFFLLSLVFSSRIFAATTATVTATVTVQNVSVTATDGTITYGTLATSASAGTNGSDTQTATNNGNITEDLLIRGADSANWTLAGSASTDQYIHRFCITTCASAPTNYTALTTSYQQLVEDLASSGTQTFDLYITTPSSSSNFSQQSVNVTVLATTPD